MEGLLDFFDQTESQPPTSPRTSTTTQPLPSSLPPEVTSLVNTTLYSAFVGGWAEGNSARSPTKAE